MSLEVGQRAKVAAIIETIEEIGFYEALTGTKYIKYLEDKIYEIRVEWKSNTFRVFTFTLVGKKIVLTHGFTKKTQKTPRKEIEKAKKYRKDFISRFEKGVVLK
jgi:phage-related protein